MSQSGPEKSDGYIPSPPAAFVGVLLSVGIVALAFRDSFTVDYDAKATIAIMSVLIGGVFGFDYRRGRWKGESPLPPIVPPELRKEEPPITPGDNPPESIHGEDGGD